MLSFTLEIQTRYKTSLSKKTTFVLLLIIYFRVFFFGDNPFVFLLDLLLSEFISLKLNVSTFDKIANKVPKKLVKFSSLPYLVNTGFPENVKIKKCLLYH